MLWGPWAKEVIITIKHQIMKVLIDGILERSVLTIVNNEICNLERRSNDLSFWFEADSGLDIFFTAVIREK